MDQPKINKKDLEIFNDIDARNYAIKIALSKTKAINELCTEYNKKLSSLRKALHKDKLYNQLTEDQYKLYKKDRKKALKEFWESREIIYAKNKISSDTKFMGIPLSSLTKSDQLPSFIVAPIQPVQPGIIFPPIEGVPQQQPGTLIIGEVHPCCRWYRRTEVIDWDYRGGPTLSPDDYNLTGFNTNWIDNNKFQVYFRIDGNVDDEYTQRYQSFTTFSNYFFPVRKGTVSFTIKVHFNEALIDSDGNDELWADDYGWAGAYYACDLWRRRNDVSEVMYKSLNVNPYSWEFGTHWIPLAERVIHESHWNCRTAPYPLQDFTLQLSRNPQGKRIDMKTDDFFILDLYFLFFVQAFGDECWGAIKIHGTRYVEVDPIELTLEECEE